MIDLPPPQQEIIVTYEEPSLQGQNSPLREIYSDAPINFYDITFNQPTERTTMSKEQVVLLLYIKESCPYCQKVLSELRKMKKAVPAVDISKDQQARDELIRVGGKKQVPCLFINGEAHYESGWIINWLKKNKNLLQPASG